MRVSIKIYLKHRKIPTNYRKTCMSLVKTCFQLADIQLYNQLYELNINQLKPFTFMVKIPIDICSNGFFYLKGDYITFTFSTNNDYIMKNFLLGLNKFKDICSVDNWFSNKIEIGEVFFRKQKVIDTETVKFKILSPILVRKFECKKSTFISSVDNTFDDWLFNNVSMLVRFFLNKEITEDSFNVDGKNMKPVKIPHYGGEIGNSGDITIRAEKDILKLIYDIGIGAKRSQGFGFLEVSRD